MKSNIRLIACDYDGTLSSSMNKITQRTVAALNQVHDDGYLLALATGRSVSPLPEQIRALPFDYFIAANGARVVDVKSGKTLSANPISHDIVLEIFSIMKGKAYASNIFLDGQFVMDFRSFRRIRLAENWTFSQKVNGFFYFLLHVPLSYNVQWVAKHTRKQIDKLVFSFEDEVDCQTSLDAIQALDIVEAVTTYGHDIEITAKGVNKGQALVDLCEVLSIDKEEVIAFGDSGNDLSMVDAVGCFLAPANAAPEILSAATKVIPSVDEDGVAVVLEELIHQGVLEDVSG